MKTGLLLFVLLGSAATASANLVSDGSFESPAVPAGSYTNYVGGDTIGAWNVVGADVWAISSTYGEPGNGMPAFNAEDGSVSLDLTGAGNNGFTSGVSQTIATTQGASYALKFWVGTAISDNGFPLYQTIGVVDLSIAGGPTLVCGNHGMSPGSIDWEYFLIGFRAKGPTTNLTFTCGSLLTDYVGLDNVSVVQTATPEPAPFAVMGLGVLGFLARRRRK